MYAVYKRSQSLTIVVFFSLRNLSVKEGKEGKERRPLEPVRYLPLGPFSEGSPGGLVRSRMAARLGHGLPVDPHVLHSPQT